MKIKFANDRINEFKSGDFHAINDGSPIEVTSDLGAELLEAKHLIDGEWVPVFEKAASTPEKPAVTASATKDVEDESTETKTAKKR